MGTWRGARGIFASRGITWGVDLQKFAQLVVDRSRAAEVPPNRKLLRRRHQSSQKKRRTSQKCGTKLLRRRHQSSQKFRKYSGRQFLGPPAKLLRTPRKLLRTLDTNFSEVTRGAIRISSAASGANQNLESPRLVSLIDSRFCCVGLP